MVDKRYRKWGLKALQYGIGVLAIAWIVTGTEWERVFSLLQGLTLIPVIVVIFVTFAEFIARFFMWHILFASVGPTQFVSAINVDLVIRFINQLFPSRLSGRSVAPVVIKHYTGFGWARAVALAGVHTSIHALLYAVAAVIGLGMAITQLSIGLAIIIASSTFLYFIAGGSIMLAGRRLDILSRLLGPLLRHLPKLPNGEIIRSRFNNSTNFTERSATVFRQLTNDPILWLLYTVGWTGKLMIFPAIRVWLLLAGLGVAFEPLYFLPFFLVMAYSVTLLPLTPGGIGIAEASAVLVFIGLGVPREAIVPVILIDRFMGVYLAAIIGGLPVLQLDLSDLRT